MTDTPEITQTLRILAGRFAVCRLDPDDSIPVWAWRGEFVSVTRTPTELSIVCPDETCPGEITREVDWRALVVEGQLDFSLVGILAELSGALAEAGISIFVVSTYDTDYLLVRDEALDRAIGVLEARGHRIVGD